MSLEPFADDVDKRKWLRTQPSYGPAWDAAIEFGIDVSLIEQNLRLSLEERLAHLERMLALQADLRPEGPVFGDPPAP